MKITVSQSETATNLDLVIIRIPKRAATNGILFINGEQTCHCIELPWKNNEPRISCIPEGKYRLSKRYSPQFGQHLYVEDVPRRTGILIHPANDAKQELQGCIAPVTTITAPGKGTQSRLAMAKIISRVYKAMDDGKAVWLSISSSQTILTEAVQMIADFKQRKQALRKKLFIK